MLVSLLLKYKYFVVASQALKCLLLLYIYIYIFACVKIEGEKCKRVNEKDNNYKRQCVMMYKI